jgi:hypothetical protein
MTIEAYATVLVDSFSRGRCRYCHVSVVWYRTAGGSWLPFDGPRPKLERIRQDLTQASAPAVGDIARRDLHWRNCADRRLRRANGEPHKA